jgi:hypothetical protein
MNQQILIVILIVIILLLSYNVKVLMNKNLNENFTVNVNENILSPDLEIIKRFAEDTIGNITVSNASGTISSEQLKANENLLNEIKDMNKSLTLLIEKQKNQPVQQAGSVSTKEIPTDINTYQKEQSNYIEKLNNRLDNLKKIYAIHLQKQIQQSQNIKYDKIPVYSSCIIAEANGHYTIPP